MSTVEPSLIAFRSKVVEEPAAAWAADAVAADEEGPAEVSLFRAVVPPRAFMSIVDDEAVPAAAVADWQNSHNMQIFVPK